MRCDIKEMKISPNFERRKLYIYIISKIKNTLEAASSGEWGQSWE